MNNKNVQSALNNTLSSLRVSQRDAASLLTLAKGGKKVKKKLSIAFVVVIVIILGLITALAITFGWTEGVYFLQKEQKQGNFSGWTIQEQIKLVDSLVQDGYIKKSTDTERLNDSSLNDEDRSVLATNIMMEWLRAPEEHIAFRPIMERIWGTFGDWTIEQKAWFTTTMIEAGIQQPDFERYVMPTNEDIPLDMATRIATAHTSTWIDIPLSVLRQTRIYASFVLLPKRIVVNGNVEYTAEHDQPVWLFEMGIDGTAQIPSYIVALVDPISGKVDTHQFVQSLQQRKYGRNWPDIALQADDFFREQKYLPFMEWPLEARAEWSQKIREQIINLSKDTVLDYALLALSKYAYGVPHQDMLQEDQAVQLALKAIQDSYDLDDGVLNRYDLRYLYFDISDATQSKWRLHLSATGKSADMLTNQHPEHLTNYVVELNASTGEVIDILHYEQSDFYGYEALLKQL